MPAGRPSGFASDAWVSLSPLDKCRRTALRSALARDNELRGRPSSKDSVRETTGVAAMPRPPESAPAVRTAAT
eukprot:scaffold2579_cov356-Prasinococcus_capsulatus_cf.AAC.6